MRLVLLGTTGYHPSEQRHTACYLLPECGVMLDAGTGMYRAARYLQSPRLDIFLTHVHLDHCVGLTYLFSTQYERPLERVTVHAEADKLAALDEHLFSPLIFPQKPPMEFAPLGDRFDLGDGGRITWFPLEHAGGTVGYRLDWPGRSMAYVTDTTAALDAPYVDAIRGVDLLLHECYFPDHQADFARKTCHSFTSPVAQVARRAGVGRLVLVHTNPLAVDDDPVGLESARRIFPHTEVGRDLTEIDF